MFEPKRKNVDANANESFVSNNRMLINYVFVCCFWYPTLNSHLPTGSEHSLRRQRIGFVPGYPIFLSFFLIHPRNRSMSQRFTRRQRYPARSVRYSGESPASGIWFSFSGLLNFPCYLGCHSVLPTATSATVQPACSVRLRSASVMFPISLNNVRR